MKRKYLSDSYDVVKRYWADILLPVGKLYADSKFVPATSQLDYSRVTGIPIFDERPQNYFGILLDPDTGIPAPGEGKKRVTSKHAHLDYIVELYGKIEPRYLVCFDQSYHRRHTLTREGQRTQKRDYLLTHELHSFYYQSHAPFLFASRSSQVIGEIQKTLLFAGISPNRLEPNVNI